jgi:hypothetical protein
VNPLLAHLSATERTPGDFDHRRWEKLPLEDGFFPNQESNDVSRFPFVVPSGVTVSIDGIVEPSPLNANTLILPDLTYRYTGTSHQVMAADFGGGSGRRVVSSVASIEEALAIDVELLVPRVTTNAVNRTDALVAFGTAVSGEAAAEITIMALEP